MTRTAWLYHARPAWARIHAESLAAGDVRRARYAAWILAEIVAEEHESEGGEDVNRGNL